MNSNRLLDRMIEVLVAARLSPRRTTITAENPADRSIPGTPQHMADVSHGSLFRTRQWLRLVEAIPDSSSVTFANCRLDGPSQKYFTIWFTNDAARVLDTLAGPDYQCNHPPGTHKAVAGGRDAFGFWKSTDTAAYTNALCAKLAMAHTFARTGDPTPLALRAKPPMSSDEIVGGLGLPLEGRKSSDLPSETLDLVTEGAPSAPAAAGAPSVGAQPNSPRRLSFSTPARPGSQQVAPGAPSTSGRSRSVSVGGIDFFPGLGGFSPGVSSPQSSVSFSPAINLGGGVPDAPREYPLQDASTRSVRSSVRTSTAQSLELRIQRERELAAKRDARASKRAAAVPDPIPEEDSGDESDAPYVSFTGTPVRPSAFESSEMEATVASLVLEAKADEILPDRCNLTD